MPEFVLEQLLAPIPGTVPGGEDLRYSPLYEKVKEARREDDGLSQGAWQRERKTADFALVIELAQDALREKSKDLQLAAWLTEALVRQKAFAGLRQGLSLCFGLVDRLWDCLYPPLEDGDAELRAAPLAWVSGRLDALVRTTPLARAGYDWFAYKNSRVVGYESAATTPEQKKAREKALKEGKPAPEDFDKSFVETPRAFYAAAVNDLDAALETLGALEECANRKFGEAAPGFGKLRSAIEEVRHTVGQLLEKKREAEPEAQAPAAAGDSAADAPPLEAATPAVAGAPRPGQSDDAAEFESASRALKAGRQQEAFQILNRAVATQSSGRGRFLRKLQLARLCIAAGRDLIAQPLLEDLAATIDAYKLEEWEERETIAGALVTILQSSKRVQGDAKEKQKFFERICRLDPSQALAC